MAVGVAEESTVDWRFRGCVPFRGEKVKPETAKIAHRFGRIELRTFILESEEGMMSYLAEGPLSVIADRQGGDTWPMMMTIDEEMEEDGRIEAGGTWR